MNCYIAAVIVAYHPKVTDLLNLAAQLSAQCSKVIIVDNSEPACIELVGLSKNSAKIQVVSFNRNLGVGAAQNIGIRMLMNTSCIGVLLFDQDSSVSCNYVDDMWRVYLNASKHCSKKISAIGPKYTDIKQRTESPFVKINGLKITRVNCSSEIEFIEVDCLIASGCLLLMSALSDVGLMREDLFIDYVDTEWCLRAGQIGYQCFGACSVGMDHSIGDEWASLFGRRFTLHSPLRHYYLMRNAISLYLRSDLPLQWKVADAIRTTFRFLIYSVLGKPRSRHILMMTKGLWHGIIGRMGKL